VLTSTVCAHAQLFIVTASQDPPPFIFVVAADESCRTVLEAAWVEAFPNLQFFIFFIGFALLCEVGPLSGGQVCSSSRALRGKRKGPNPGGYHTAKTERNRSAHRATICTIQCFHPAKNGKKANLRPSTYPSLSKIPPVDTCG
jgi:hypothetical protein